MNNVLNEGKEDFSRPILWIVIPCYNEEDVLPITAPMFLEQIQTMISKKKISARVLQEFAGFQEVNIFLRGMIPLVGYKNATVYYERHERIAGESHYPLSKMLAIAVDGITSLSVRPISIITGAGCVVSLIGFVGIIWAIITAIIGNAVPGWASIVCIVCFLGGIQLLSLGVIGEYIGKIYLESKHRPRYIISEKTWEPYERHYKG